MIKSIIFDWAYTNENGIEYLDYVIGERSVIKIEEHRPDGEGDKWFYDIYFENGAVERIFNINSVIYDNKIDLY